MPNRHGERRRRSPFRVQKSRRIPYRDAFGSDDVSWEAVHAQAEEAARSLERCATDAPTTASRDAAQEAAQGMRSTYFAFESARLLRNAAQAPTSEQLAQADVPTRTSADALHTALARLDRLVHPEGDDGSIADGGAAVGQDHCAGRRSRTHPLRRSAPTPGRLSSSPVRQRRYCSSDPGATDFPPAGSPSVA